MYFSNSEISLLTFCKIFSIESSKASNSSSVLIVSIELFRDSGEL